MNLEFKSGENDFFKAIGITKEDEEIFVQFKKLYYTELGEKFKSMKYEKKLNAFQQKKLSLELSASSKMLQTGLQWFKDHKRKDQLTVLLLGDIFFRLAGSAMKAKQIKKGLN